MRAAFYVLLALVFGSTSAFGAVSPIMNGDGAGVEMTKEGAAPVVVSPGSIFYETSAGRVLLTGQPASTTPVENGYSATWRMTDGRGVTLKATPFDGGYDLSLTSDRPDDILKWGIGVKGSQDEFFTGAMERTVDGDQGESWKPGIDVTLDMAGLAVEMIVKPTTSVYAPFYVSSAGYGVFVRGTWPGLFDFCKTDPENVLAHFEGPAFDARIYINSDLSAVVSAHALDAGPPILPPKWAFSPWRWRDEHQHKRFHFDNQQPGRRRHPHDEGARHPLRGLLDRSAMGHWIGRLRRLRVG